MAGNAADELDDGRLEPTQRKSGALSSVVLIGFLLGAVGTYRWLSGRLQSEVTVDIAPPQSSAAPSSGDGPEPAAPQSGTRTATPPAEY